MFSEFNHLIITRWYPTNPSDSTRTSAISSLIREALDENLKVLVIVPREDISKISVFKFSEFEIVINLPWRRRPGYYATLKRVLKYEFNFLFHFNKLNKDLKKLSKILKGLSVKSCTIHGNLFTHAFILNSLGYKEFNFVNHEADVKSKDTRIGVDFFSDRIRKIGFRSSSIKRKIYAKFSELKNIPSFIVRSGISNKELLEYSSYKPYDNEPVLKLVTVSRLIKRKNIDKVLKYLTDIDCKWSLDIYGDGTEYKKLVNYSNQLGISSNVIFHGKVPRKKLLDTLQDYDIFVLISENETLGLCYLEALSRGLFVIGSNGEGISDYITDGVNGKLVDPASKNEFLEAVGFYRGMNEVNYALFKSKIYENNLNLLHNIASQAYINDSVYKPITSNLN